MEPSPETISSRRDKLNAQIIGKWDQRLQIHRECLLDAFQALYDECSNDALQKYDRQIGHFVEKHKSTVVELKKLRVNVSDFEIKDVIGRGHFGEVHVVKEKQTGDVYAMKTIRKCDSVDGTSYDIERDIMAFGSSPWITSLQYAFQDSIYLFYVMEYHPGGDLLGLLYRQGGTLPESAATFYLAELVLALENLHGMGFVHRDIKPDNILLDRCGHLKLVDFGSAARLDANGTVDKSIPAGTPDYIAPEVLQSVDRKPASKRANYGAACDFWSLGVLAYELTIGKTPFLGPNTATTYSRIMNHSAHLKFPSNALLTQGFVSLIKSLITDAKSRLASPQIKRHAVFKNVHFDTIRDQVPPYVPKITSLADTSNFTDVDPKKPSPHIDNFKKRTQFSGRNLPFVGFTYTPGGCERGFTRASLAKDETVKRLREELDAMKRQAMEREDWEPTKLALEKKLAERTAKLEGVESVRGKLERDLAASIAETGAARRLLDLERKDRAELERKALELIKAAKMKWETTERNKVEPLRLEIEQQKERIDDLEATNRMLNEQLQRACKLEDKHKESLEVAKEITRRSVVGLESRLERAVADSLLKITSLQETLDATLHQKLQLEETVRVLKGKEKELTKSLDKSNEEYRSLSVAATEAEKLVKTLEQKVNQLERDVESSEKLNQVVLGLKTQLQSLQDANTELQRKSEFGLKLEKEHKTLAEQLERLRVENDTVVKQLETQVQEHQKKIHELESKLAEEDQKSTSLKKQLIDSESAVDDNQQLKELRLKTWKMEKELGNAKIDKRILERELKDANTEIKSLGEQIDQYKAKIAENKKMHETSLLELNAINENLSLELIKLKENCKSLEDKLGYERCKLDGDKTTIDELKGVIKITETTITELRSKISCKDAEFAVMAERCKNLEQEKTKALDDVASAVKRNDVLANQLKDVQRKLESTQANLEALREACVIIETQVIEYEKLNASIQQEKSTMAQNTEKLIQDLCRAKEEIQEAKKQTNEEKSLKLLAETKAKRLGEDVECLQSECEAYKEQLIKYKECANDLSEELTLAEEKVTDLEVTVKSHERHIEDFVSENNQLKEEVSQYLTQLSALKEAHFKVKQQVQELKSAKGGLTQKVEELVDELNAYDEREMKHESIIKQQTKLIDYLQIKIDEHAKKKSLTDKIFGHSKKENQPPISMAINYRELEVELQKQRRINRDLQEEIYKLKVKSPKLSRHRSEIASPKRQIIVEQSNVEMEGWIKLLRNGSWDKLYACATQSSFTIFQDASKSRVVERVDGSVKLVLEPLASEIGVGIADSDLRFIVKLERGSEGSLILMALSLLDRDKWYKALMRLFGASQLDTLVTLAVDLDVHCLLELSRNVRVLGTNQGLYADSLVAIAGPKYVRAMCTIPESKLVVIVAETSGVLIWCDLNHLLNLCQCAPCTKPHLSYRKAAPNFEGFHFLEASKYGRHQMVCAATSRQLVILKYHVDANEFGAVRVMDTAEPLGCALFTEHSLIVGADKFFEIDLSTFGAEEFLDVSDAKLMPATACHKLKSFPMGVIEVCDNPREFLLCYKEFCVFVDEYGRCSRDRKIESEYLPSGFYYVKPFLYVVGVSGVGIWRLEEDEVGAPVTLELERVRVLGTGRMGVYVHHEGKIKVVDGRKLLDGDDVSEVSEQEDRFSFTSSMVHSLDGNLSDAESSGAEGSIRRVKFSQTNL